MLPIKLHSPRWLNATVLKLQTYLGHLVVLWKTWDLRTLILISFGLQVFLILFAPFRKKSGNFVLISSIWLAYLAADYVAIQAVSMVPNYSITHGGASNAPHPDMLAFWAPFLLVHLGGPDPITALALEDNELWLRTVLHLVASMYATGRVFFQSLPTNSGLVFPTMLMLFAGFFKYLERVLSMYYARSEEFKESFSRYRGLRNYFPASIHDYQSKDYPDNLIVKMCNFARCFFAGCNLAFVDTKLDASDGEIITYLMQDPSMTAENGFTIAEIELNLAYEVFYTKMIVIHKKFGIIIRCASFLFQAVSLVVWILFINKQPFHAFDIGITYTLLVGAISIDSMAFLMVPLSYWQMGCVGMWTRRASLYSTLHPDLKRTWGAYWGPEKSPLWPRIRRLFFRRWSESVYQFNVLHYSLYTLPFAKLLPRPIKKQLGSIIYVSKKWFADELRDFIFDEIKSKSNFDGDLGEMEKMCNSKGEWTLKSLDSSFVGSELEGFYNFFKERTYVECLMSWHIATELLYQTTIGETRNSSRAPNKDFRKFCKTLSDYMMYIFCWQPGMVSSATGSNTNLEFQPIASELRDFATDGRSAATLEERLQSACQSLMDLESHAMVAWNPSDKYEHATLIVSRGAFIARELKKLEERLQMSKKRKHVSRKRPDSIDMWEVTAKVWVELMCYIATNCKGSIHTAKLKQGGELLTLVWLLMLHFGISKLYITNT